MTQHSPSRRPRTPWAVVVGFVAACLGSIVTLLQLGAVAVIVGVFALAGDEALFAVVVAALWLLVAAALIGSIVLGLSGRGWVRVVLAVLAVATGIVVTLLEAPPVGSILVAVGVVLLWLPSAHRWFPARLRRRRDPVVEPVVAPPVVEP